MTARNPGDLKIGVKAIRAKCLDCCNGSRKEVDLCTCTTCPLWPIRYGSSSKAKEIVKEEREKVKSGQIDPDETHWAEEMNHYGRD